MKPRTAKWLCLPILLCCAGPVFGQEPEPKEEVQRLSASPMDSFNKELPSWLIFSGQLRGRAEGYTGGSFEANSADAYLLTRLLLNMEIRPANSVKLFFQGMDAHAPWKNALPAGEPYRDTMDLGQGYLELGEIEEHGFGLRLGRQELAFGEQRLIGAAPWWNTPRAFDGLRGSFAGNGFRLDVLAASAVEIRQEQFDESIPGNNIYGFYTSFGKLVRNATIEPYFFWRRESGLATELGAPGVSNFATVGFRWVGKFPANFDYAMEMAKQAGSLGGETLRAWAGHWSLGYTVMNARFIPRIFAEFNFASGDSNPTDNRGGTFNQLYPTGHDKFGLADRVAWQNIEHIRGGAEFMPTRKWTLSARYNAYWLADPHDALYGALGTAVARSATGGAGRYVGREADFVTGYKLNPRLNFAGGYGYFVPGTFLDHTTPGISYTYPFATATYDF